MFIFLGFDSEYTQSNKKKRKMARGHQKIQSQAKAAEKQAKMKKQQGHSANDQKKAAQKALVHVCVLCKVTVNLWETQ